MSHHSSLDRLVVESFGRKIPEAANSSLALAFAFPYCWAICLTMAGPKSPNQAIGLSTASQATLSRSFSITYGTSLHRFAISYSS